MHLIPAKNVNKTDSANFFSLKDANFGQIFAKILRGILEHLEQLNQYGQLAKLFFKYLAVPITSYWKPPPMLYALQKGDFEKALPRLR